MGRAYNFGDSFDATHYLGEIDFGDTADTDIALRKPKTSSEAYGIGDSDTDDRVRFAGGYVVGVYVHDITEVFADDSNDCRIRIYDGSTSGTLLYDSGDLKLDGATADSTYYRYCANTISAKASVNGIYFEPGYIDEDNRDFNRYSLLIKCTNARDSGTETGKAHVSAIVRYNY